MFARPVLRSVDDRLILLARPNGLTHPRLGLALAKRKLRKAVWRNRVKRLVRESFRLHRQDLPACDIIVMAKPGIEQCANEQLHRQLTRHWQRLARRAARAASGA